MSCRVIWSNLKTTCCLNFFSLEKCICPAVQICNGESFGSFWECRGKQPVTQKNSFPYSVSFRRNGNVRPCRIGRPNAMVSIAIGETFLLMECINALSRGLLKRSCNLAWKDLWQLALWPRVLLLCMPSVTDVALHAVILHEKRCDKYIRPARHVYDQIYFYELRQSHWSVLTNCYNIVASSQIYNIDIIHRRISLLQEKHSADSKTLFSFHLRCR